MEKPDSKGQAQLTLLGAGIAVVVSLTWSAGLIGKGIWQLLAQSNVQYSQNGQNVPDSFSGVSNVPTGVFAYGGSTAWAPLRLAVDSVIQSERPELQFRYVQSDKEPPGSEPGIQMLLRGELAFVQSSYSLLPEEYSRARELGMSLKQVPVAVDGIAVAVHPSLNIPGLTLRQLQGIYTGKIVNWQELGGPDLKITTYSPPLSTGGMVNFFASDVLQGQEFGSSVKFILTTTKALRKLANNPGGIYYDSAPAILPQCTVKPLPLGRQEGELVAPYQQPLVPAAECPNQRNKLNTKAFRSAQYPLTNYLYVVFLQNEAVEEQIGQAYANFLLTPQGQKLISKTGFVRLD